MRRKRVVAIAIFIALVIVQMMSIPSAPSSWRTAATGQSWASEIYQEGGNQQLALLEVKGEIIESSDNSSIFATTGGYNHQVFLEQLEYAFSDNAFKGVVLYVDSPGGGVFESDQIYQEIVRLKNEFNKPLVVYMGKMAASGGYYISAPADKILANRNTITGSIGVVMGNLNFKELLERYGVKDQTFVSGENKTIMSQYHEMTEEQAQIIQSIIDESYQYFVDVIVEGRGLEREKVLEIADGRVYTALQAKQAGLIDELGSLEDAFDQAASLAGVVDPTIVSFQANTWNFSNFLYKLPNMLGRSWNLSSSLDELPSLHQPSIMYIWKW